MKKITLFIISCTLFLSGCATVYFPLKKDTYFQNKPQAPKTVALLPFEVDCYSPILISNTMEMLDKKTKEAKDFTVKALTEELASKSYKITKYLSADEIQKDDFDKDTLTILDELYNEFNSAEYSLRKNLNEDKGKPFDYSIGLLANELKDTFQQKPDILAFVFPGGYINDLGVFSPLSKASYAIMSLGMSLLNPTPNDSIVITTVLIDTKNGDIIWYNSNFSYSRSLLSFEHIKEAIHKNLSALPNAKE